MPIPAESIALINASFNRVKWLEQIWGDDIPWSAIAEGIEVNGEKVHIANKARGIFKPKQLSRGILSIKTTAPRVGRTNIYSDAETTEGFYRYSLQMGDPNGGGNKNLWEAYEDRMPFVYFHAVAESIYKAIWPCFVDNIRPEEGYCSVIVGAQTAVSSEKPKVVIYQLPTAPERAYAIRASRVRLFQATFRENVLRVYDNRCAISGLPVKLLLDAAHITPDSEEDSSTDVTNGIALSRVHHRAYDSNLIGISPDLKVLVSERLLSVADGPMLDAIKSNNGKYLSEPSHRDARPDRDRLARRFEQFTSAEI
ncbi:MAG: HNH endonuclease [Gammaproteobacteria bacterium]|nr:HNH endonuclease [Gammaproteobacteria bacterium]MDP2348209.1 HNH endonuclease [Gammaproteobacteria bacterium]